MTYITKTKPTVSFTGDSGTGGKPGAVPGPAAGDAALSKFLGAGGGFSSLPGVAGEKDNLASATNPDVNDDNTQGYGIGSIWINTTDDLAYICFDDSTGAAKWREFGTITTGAGQTRPDAFFLGDILHYTGITTEITDELIFVRNWLSAGTVLTDMEFFPTQSGGASRNIHLGIYDQTDPTDPSLEPNSKVREITPVVANTVTADTFNIISLTADYIVPTTGYYWFAFLSEGTGGPATKVKPVITSTYIAGFTPVRFKSGQSTLPASAGAVVEAGGALVYIAARE